MNQPLMTEPKLKINGYVENKTFVDFDVQGVNDSLDKRISMMTLIILLLVILGDNHR